MLDENKKIATDWTFPVCKNYNIPDAKCYFTGKKGTSKEVFALAIVRSTAVSQISHFIMQAATQRKQFSPAVHYTDTYPSSKIFWKSVLGDGLQQRLGLFHLQHRIIERLDRYCELYWKCLLALKQCAYLYNSEDYEALIKALMEGNFNCDGTVLSSSDIEDLKLSKRWKERYGEFLRTCILGGVTIKQNLEAWIVEWKGKTDDTGCSVFSHKTENTTTKDQFSKVDIVSYVPGLPMYQQILPGPRSTHGLPKWLSDPQKFSRRIRSLRQHWVECRACRSPQSWWNRRSQYQVQEGVLAE
jgi:hypothetical protein